MSRREHRQPQAQCKARAGGQRPEDEPTGTHVEPRTQSPQALPGLGHRGRWSCHPANMEKIQGVSL